MTDSDKNQFVDHWNTANPIVFNVLEPPTPKWGLKDLFCKYLL